jgi:cation diffusion facilitator CzcD-associated flavoprotein CzcO
VALSAASVLAETRLDADTIVVGAGFGGLGLALQMLRAGQKSFLVLERASEAGGTWRDNVYPGCACDIPAMLYSFSFSTHVEWTRLFPGQPELLRYLKALADRSDLRAKIRFNSELEEARFDESRGTWTLRLKDGARLVCRSLVLAMGPLSKPNIPQIPGAERFAGPAFHSSRWDYSVDLRGKGVAVVGTGASAIQFVPQIAPEAAAVTIFQRTPPWVIPRNDKPVATWRNALRSRFRPYAWLVRKAIYWMLEIRAIGFVVNPKILERREADIRRFLEHSVPDPELRAKLTPEYRAGCKRILISDDYYPALQRPNVELIASPLAEIREHSVVAADGTERAADAIVYATGFNATEGLAPVRIFGRNGTEIDEVWRNGMNAYLGTSVAGFPNMFFIIGPNTGLGHNSMIFMMEAQYRYILGALDYLRASGARSIDVQSAVQSSFNATLQRRLAGTVWASGCSSWYLDARGKNTSLWPGFTFAFKSLTRSFDPRKYRLN